MPSWISRRVTFANVAMTLVLVFAMTGGAYAAKKYLITSTKQISPGVLKALAGKSGPAGPAGPQGSPGSQGEKGLQGLHGESGAQGSTGPSGATGATGAKGATGPSGATGSAGATGSTGPAGQKGATGPEGVCSTAGCTLPKNVTETGTWEVAAVPIKVIAPSNFIAVVPLSFAIPLATPLTEAEAKVHVIASGESDPAGCKGTIEKPGAESRNLCIFEAEFNVNTKSIVPVAPGIEETEAANTTGTVLQVHPESGKETERVYTYGTWAVTG